MKSNFKERLVYTIEKSKSGENIYVLGKCGQIVLDVDNLKDVIKSAFDRLWFVNNNMNLEETINNHKNFITGQKQILIKRDEEAIESNKRFLERQEATGEIWDNNTAMRTILQNLKADGMTNVTMNNNEIIYSFKK